MHILEKNRQNQVQLVFLKDKHINMAYVNKGEIWLQRICCCWVTQSCPTLCDPTDCACQASLSVTISQSLPPSSCTLHQWCHPAISSSDALFSFCPQSFPPSGTFPMSQLFESGDQNTVASASASVLPTRIQGWSPLRWTGWISLQSKGLSEVFSSTTVRRHQFFGALPSLQFSSHNRTWSLGRL